MEQRVEIEQRFNFTNRKKEAKDHDKIHKDITMKPHLGGGRLRKKLSISFAKSVNVMLILSSKRHEKKSLQYYPTARFRENANAQNESKATYRANSEQF